MTTLYKYSFTCNDEGVSKQVWREESDPVPTKCPDDTSHVINTTSIRIVERVEENNVKVQEETIPTGGHFKALGRKMDIAANETKTKDEVFPFDISAMAIEFTSDSSNQGDELQLVIGPDTIIGTVSNDVTSGDTVINVSQTVIDYVSIGYNINLFDGVNTSDLGRVTAVDKDNLTITAETAVDQSFSSVMPTYVRMSVYTIDDYTIGKPGRWTIGESKIGGSFIPAGTVVRIIYKNNENASKEFISQLEYLY